jgi:hypothetical protein
MSKRPGDLGYAAGWCIHYRYNRDLKGDADTCEAGVSYSKFYGTKFETRPCFLDDKTGESKPNAVLCEHLRRPTAEEIALHEDWLEARMNRMRVVMLGIAPWRTAHKGESAQEIVECPVCNGRLHLSIAACNGHVHGHCETAECVSWVE